MEDDPWVLEFYRDHASDAPADLVREVLANEKMWDQDLRKIPGLEEAVLQDLCLIREKGAAKAFESCL